MTSPLLELRGITKRFGGVAALHDVSFDLRAGEILALLGENGAGKSTLMKILSGSLSTDAGEIRFSGQPVKLRSPLEARALGIGIIHQEFYLVPQLSVRENIFLGCEQRTRWGSCDDAAMEQQTHALLARLGAKISPNTPLADLSIAEQQFVEIAKSLRQKSRVLILDEPTATLTPAETKGLFQVMRELRQDGVALVFISHHLDEIFTIADRVVCLRDGRFVGERDTASCSREEMIRLMVGRDVAQVFPLKTTLGDGAFSSPPVLDVRHLQRRKNLPDLSFQLCGGEILGIAGLVGSGRTELVRALIGADPAFRKEVWLNGEPADLSSPADAQRAGIGLVPEDRQRQGLIGCASLLDNTLVTHLRKVSHPRWRFIRHPHARRTAGRLFAELHVKWRALTQPVSQLSGGNQQKIVLAKWLHADCRVLILDEPTRGIDIGAKAEIYQLIRALAARGIAFIMISSELPEILGLCDRILVMRSHQIAHIFPRGANPSPESVMHHATGGAHV